MYVKVKRKYKRVFFIDSNGFLSSYVKFNLGFEAKNRPLLYYNKVQDLNTWQLSKSSEIVCFFYDKIPS